LADSNYSQRLDRWLFFTRVFKSRALAQSAIEAGHVSVNGQTIFKTSDQLKIGDKLVIMRENQHLWLIVRGIGIRRGPASEAQTLYDVLT
jgi:ribosome-associated heat shock protein Hsp15